MAASIGVELKGRADIGRMATVGRRAMDRLMVGANLLSVLQHPGRRLGGRITDNFANATWGLRVKLEQKKSLAVKYRQLMQLKIYRGYISFSTGKLHGFGCSAPVGSVDQSCDSVHLSRIGRGGHRYQSSATVSTYTSRLNIESE